MTIQFIPTEEQAMLRDSVRRWGESRDPRHADAFESIWSHAAEMGWLMAGLPEEQGGLGGSAYDIAIIAEELGRVLVRAPFAEIAGTAAQLLLRLAPDRVAAIAQGISRPVVAHDEAEARGDRGYVATAAMPSGDLWLLTGRKTAIVGAPHADVLLVSAQVEGQGITLFELASADAPMTAFTTIDDRAAAEVRLHDTPARLIGAVGAAMPALEVALDYAFVLQSAEAVGAMQRALEMTRDYLRTRRQYGQLIGDFQALRHRLADMFIEVEQARSMVLRGLDSLTDSSSRGAMAAATKARVAQAGLFVAGNAIQLHGGIGVTDEYPLGQYFKRLLAFDQRHGNAAVQVQRFAQLSVV